MLNFFVQLINTIGLPVVLVGTYKAISVLSGEFRQTRRGTGQGDLVWDRMKKDENWNWFVECLWHYQYTQVVCPLTEELNHALYDCTQGITDFAVKLYMLTQIEAITSGKETITPEQMHLTAQESLRMAMPILNALRTNDMRILSTVEDVHILDLDPYFEKAQSDLNRDEQLKVLSRIRSNKMNLSSPASTPEKKLATVHNIVSKENTRRVKQDNSFSSSLLGIARLGEQHKLNAYQSLKQAGLIRSINEFLQDETT